MKRPWLVFVIFLSTLAVAIVITTIINIQREKRFKHFDFPQSMIVNNYTKYKRADTLAMVILNRLFKYDTVELAIYYYPEQFNNNAYEIYGFIQKNQFKDHSYIVFMRKRTIPIPVRRFLSHEMIHLDQMEKGELDQIIGTSKMIYKGEVIDMLTVPYDERPYEQDAFARQNGVLKEVNDLVYSK
jgi:hypothetical protein